MGSAVEEMKIESNLELKELEHLFSWAAEVGRGEILPEDFVYFEDIYEKPLLVRRSAVTSIHPGCKDSTSYITLGGERIAVRGSYEATIAKVVEPALSSTRA